MDIREVIRYLVVGYSILIPALLLVLSWSTTFKGEGKRGPMNSRRVEEKEEYKKAA